MGALTLKVFPFELRGWELEKFESIDITDSFGSDIKICTNNKKIIQIEAGYNNSKNYSWLHDKGRHFFDCFAKKSETNKDFLNLPKNLSKNIYLFDLCKLKYKITNYFTIIYENVTVNLFCLLLIYVEKFSFIKLKKAEKRKINNNIEANFSLKQDLTKLKDSNFCLIISSNLRFEGSSLNIALKQRVLKSNFKCFIIGSFLNLTYNLKFLGKTTTNVLKSITEGTHFICQDLKLSQNPIFILNSEFFKRNDNGSLRTIIFYLNQLNSRTKLNTLNLSIFETGIFYLKKPDFLNKNDFLQFGSLYYLNLTPKNNLNRLLKTNLLYLNYNKVARPVFKKVFVNQNINKEDFINEKLSKYIFILKFDQFLYVPVKILFETRNTFYTTQGLVKQTNPVIVDRKTDASWKILRILFNSLKKNIVFLDNKENFKLHLNFGKRSAKLNHLAKLTYKVCKDLNQKNNSTIDDNSSSFRINKNKLLRVKKIKFFNTKMKFWLNDFFTGGKDEFSKNSLTMIRCSGIKRLQSTNFAVY
jgi:NADH dehydrogenase/NADH:ubiquinone oxidoreductase subunit G